MKKFGAYKYPFLLYFMTNILFPWNKSIENLGKNKYSKLILETKFKTSLSNIIIISNLMTITIVFLSFFLAFYLKRLEIISIGVVALVLLPPGLRKLFDFIITNEFQQFDLDCVFILRELIVISQSTKSESQAYFLLASSSNSILNSFGRNSFIEKNISSTVSVNSIIYELEQIERSRVATYLKNIFSNWMTTEIDVPTYTTNFEKLIQAKLDDDFHDLENNITIINALIGLFPILIIFLIFIGFKNVHPLLELSLLLFIGILLLIWLLDPLRIEPIIDFFGSSNVIENFDGTMMLQDFFSLLILNQNFGKSLVQLSYNQSLANKNRFEKEIYNMNFINYQDLNEKLINLITVDKGSKLRNLFNIIFELEKIDNETVLKQIPEFIANYSSTQQYYQKKYGFIKTEKKKSGLILTLNSFTLGILSIILPYLFFINSFNFSNMSDIYLKHLLTPKLALFTSFEFLILLWVIYFIYYKSYALNSNATLYRNLLLNSFLFSLGFLFSLALLRPVIVLF